MIEIESLFNFMDFPGSWLRSVESALYQPVGIIYGKPRNTALLSSMVTASTKKVETYGGCGDEKKGRAITIGMMKTP